MILGARDFLGRVTFVTGPGKDSGKTTLLNHALGLLRAAGESPAFLGVGFDGEGGDALTAARKPRIPVEAGEVVVSAERFLRASAIDPEFLAVLPGSTALGRLAVVRARRGGSVVLVGPERNALAAAAIERIRGEGFASTVLVDGAIDRLTQVSALPGARYLFSLRVSPADLERQAARVRLLALLAALPLAEPGEGRPGAPGEGEPVLFLEGPLTPGSLAGVPEGTATLVVEDFTKVFLDPPALAALGRRLRLAVRSRVEFGGFVVILRDLSREDFLRAAGPGVPESLIAWNPLEAVPRAA